MIKIVDIAIRSHKRAPMQNLVRARISKEAGLADDFRGKPGKRQVTVMSVDSWQRACDELGLTLDWTLRRANLLIQGYEFSENDIGNVISLGDIELKICEETDPCPRMDEQQPGLTQALMPAFRGGVCCQVLQGGELAIGDELKVVTENAKQSRLF